MSEQRRSYEKYLPGDVVRMKIEIRHRPMHLRGVDAVFRMAQEPEEDELWVEGEGLRTISTQVTLADRTIGHQSEAELSVGIGGMTVPGVYRLYEIIVETYGGQSFSYKADEEEKHENAQIRGGDSFVGGGGVRARRRLLARGESGRRGAGEDGGR